MLLRVMRLIITLAVLVALLWLYIDTHTRVVETAADWDEYKDLL